MENNHGFDVKEIPVAKIGIHKKINGSDVELAQISEYYLKFKVKGSWGRRLLAVAGEVTRHGQAQPYSWSITIVSLRSKESEESHRSEWKTKLLGMFLAVTCQHASGACSPIPTRY